MKKFGFFASEIDNQPRGSALITVCIFGAIISISVAFAYRSTLFQNRMAQRSQDYLTALAVAEAGAELAMVELNKDAAATPAAFTSWGGTTTRTFTQAVRDNAGVVTGETRISVSNIDSQTPTIVATGYVPTEAAAKVARTVQLTTKNDTIPSPFGGFGIFAYEDIAINGNSDVWSYTTGSLSSGYTSDLRAQAGLGALGNVNIKPSVTVHGSVQAGGTIGGGTVTGTKVPNVMPATPPPFPAPNFSTVAPAANDNSKIVLFDSKGKKIVAGSAVTTVGNYPVTFPAPGTYVLDSLNLAGTGKMQITGSGEVTILVKNQVNVAGASGIEIANGVKFNIAAETVAFGPASSGGNGNGNGNGGSGTDSMLNITGKATVNVVADNVDFGRSMVMAGNETALTFLINNGATFNGSRKFNDDINAPASNLRIFSKGNITFNGGVNLVAAIYAPDGDLTFNGHSDFLRGVFVVNNFTSNGKQTIYLEEELTQPAGGDGSYVTSWLERAPIK